MRRFLLIAAAAAALVAVTVPSAGAASKIGQAVTPTAAGGCQANGLFLQTKTPGGNEYAAETSGVITRWSFNPGGRSPQLKLKVARPIAAIPGDPHHFQYRIVGEHPTVTVPSGGVTSFPAQIPVQAGDVIGIHTVNEALCFRDIDDDDFGFHFKSGDTLPGATDVFTRGGLDIQLSVSALLEPDCDGDGLGDETQDDDTSSCPRCLGEVATVVGTGKRDTLEGTEERDVIVGGGGNDKLVGDDGHDIVCGGAGHDLLTGGDGRDKLLGQTGNDRIRAGRHRDLCHGGAGDDGGRACERGSDADA